MKITFEDVANLIPALRKPGPKTVLHVGCGTAGPARLPECYKNGEWREIRVDIDPKVNPHIVASVTDLHQIPDQSVESVWSSHNLEHLEGFEVPAALTEFRRVLKPDGFALITLPDLQVVAKLIAEGRADEVLYTSPAGPITAMDILFGHQASQQRGNRYMAHRTGFTADRLGDHLTQAGFNQVRVLKGKSFDLWALAVIAAEQTQTTP